MILRKPLRRLTSCQDGEGTRKEELAMISCEGRSRPRQYARKGGHLRTPVEDARGEKLAVSRTARTLVLALASVPWRQRTVVRITRRR